MSQGLTGTWTAHWTQKNNRTRQRPCFPRYPPNQRVVCISCGCSWLACSAYQVPANTRHSSAQTPLCSHSSRGRNQQSRPVSFEIPSSLHRPWSGHNIHQRAVGRRGGLCTHRCQFDRSCRGQHNLFYSLSAKQKDALFRF